jgi:hypothetical protein
MKQSSFHKYFRLNILSRVLIRNELCCFHTGLIFFSNDENRSTPPALVASIGNAALRGSLVKKGATIEALAQDQRCCI